MALGANLSNICLFSPGPNCQRKEGIGKVFPQRAGDGGLEQARKFPTQEDSVCLPCPRSISLDDYSKALGVQPDRGQSLLMSAPGGEEF